VSTRAKGSRNRRYARQPGRSHPRLCLLAAVPPHHMKHTAHEPAYPALRSPLPRSGPRHPAPTPSPLGTPPHAAAKRLACDVSLAPHTSDERSMLAQHRLLPHAPVPQARSGRRGLDRRHPLERGCTVARSRPGCPRLLQDAPARGLTDRRPPRLRSSFPPLAQRGRTGSAPLAQGSNPGSAPTSRATLNPTDASVGFGRPPWHS
jgi:hypothetical protein